MAKRRWLEAGLFIFILAIINSGPCLGEQKQNSPSTSARVDKEFEFWNRLDQPGYAITVVQDAKVVYQKAFGLACLEHAVANTPKTIFNIVSASQPFTGMAVAMLAKQGKLSLDDDVRKFIPEIPDFGNSIKLRHLLYHSSGLPDWLIMQKLAGWGEDEITFTRILKAVQRQKKLPFIPGDQSSYAATNYDLLAEVVKRVTGHSFRGWTWENIFKPLKMTRTLFRDNCREVLENQAFSYTYPQYLGYFHGLDNLSLVGSHSLCTSLEDLGKWLINLATGQVGGQDLITKMFTVGKLNSGANTGFNCGWQSDTYKGLRRLRAGGDWAAFGAALVYFPEQKTGFIILSNWDYAFPDYFVDSIADIYLESFFKKEKKAQPTKAKKMMKINPEVLDRYMGDYRLSRTFMLFALIREGDKLFLAGRWGKFPLKYFLSESEFRLDVNQMEIVLPKRNKGQVPPLIWQQSGQENEAVRIELVRPTLQQRQEYTGTYSNEELATRYTVLLKEDQLLLLPPSGKEIRLSPQEKDHFSGNAQFFALMVFLRDAQGKVTGFYVDKDQAREFIFQKE